MGSVKDQRPKEKQVKLPGADHTISIQPNPARVVISVAGRVVADSRNALTLREAGSCPISPFSTPTGGSASPGLALQRASSA